MGRNKHRQYQLKVQKFEQLVERYKQTKGARQETIEMFDRCLRTVEKNFVKNTSLSVQHECHNMITIW